MLLHIPHSSINIPHKYRNEFIISDNELEEEIYRLTDWYTDELFRNGEQIISPVSRLVCDVERYLDDSQEPMTKKGMGVCYSQGTNCQPIRQNIKYSDIINEYYVPHHLKLTYRAKQEIAKNDYALVIDCHSFHPHTYNYDNELTDRPDICIGANEYTPQYLINLSISYFKHLGFNVLLNSPYLGCILPNDVDPKQVIPIMIEVNRALYMVKGTKEKSVTFEAMQRIMDEYLEKVEYKVKEAQR